MIKNIDWRLLFTPLFILAFSLFEILSVSPGNFSKHITAIILGLIAYGIASILDYRLLTKYGWVFYITVVLVLFAVLFLGENVRGSVRWFSFSGFRLQPAEISKFLLVLFLSFFWGVWSNKLPAWVRLLLSFLATFLVALLVFFEPDLGTALLYFVLWLPSILVSKVSWKLLSLLFVLVVAIGMLLFTFVIQDYQKQRLESFIKPSQDPLGSSYQMRQSIIAVGSGGWGGKGFGFGTQSHLRFLPDHHTDFIFASIAEEWGLFGSVILLGLFSALLISILDIAKTASDYFGFFFCLSTFCLLTFQIVFNICMNLGLVPVTGVPLPLVSYGGSSLISTLLLLGFVQNIALRRLI